MDKVQQVVEQLYRHHFGKMVASLLYCSRSIDPDTAEDIVQDSFSEALIHWKSNGIPLNTTGWIYKVCRNKALNKIKKDDRMTFVTDLNGHQSVDFKFNESVIDDHQLKLLFACANPALAPKVQVVITLKYVVNLRIAAIAKVLGMTIDGVDKLLSRAKQVIKKENILLEEPRLPLLRPRVHIVHKVIYLIFNEGYKSSSGKEIIRRELCEEALLMNRALIDSEIGNKDSAALQALMLFNCARFDSRFDASGSLIEFENQDRSKWNNDLILLAVDFLKKSDDEIVSSYHLEASIAYLHCIAPDFQSTNWKVIAKLYARLLQDSPNAFVELTYAVALYYAGEKTRAFEILLELRTQPYLNQYYLLNSALGKLYHLEKDNSQAMIFLAKAYELAESDADKELIGRRIAVIKKT